jgi:hypothetical protein
VAVPDRDSSDFVPLEGGVIDEDTDAQQGLDGRPWFQLTCATASDA